MSLIIVFLICGPFFLLLLPLVIIVLYKTVELVTEQLGELWQSVGELLSPLLNRLPRRVSSQTQRRRGYKQDRGSPRFDSDSGDNNEGIVSWSRRDLHHYKNKPFGRSRVKDLRNSNYHSQQSKKEDYAEDRINQEPSYLQSSPAFQQYESDNYDSACENRTYSYYKFSDQSEDEFTTHKYGLTARDGLANIGNTCYLNATLQCVFHTLYLSEYFQKGVYKNEINYKSAKKGLLAKEFGLLLNQVCKKNKSSSYDEICPYNFKQTFGFENKRFANYDQQDAHEFLVFLLEGLHEDLNRIKRRPQKQLFDQMNMSLENQSEILYNYHLSLENSFITDIFQGQFLNQVTCCECGNNSISFDNYREICLPVPKDTSSCNIDTCLKLFTAGEILDGKDAFFCPECNINSTSSKTMSIWRFPPVLILHFKRFFFTQTHSYKISTKISFPLHNLDLSPYNGDSTHESGQNPVYDLYGIIKHEGNLRYGHYTADCLNQEDGEWYNYNDARVTPIVKPSEGGNSPYILFYVKTKQNISPSLTSISTAATNRVLD